MGTHLYGRRMYETMRAWETMDDPSPVMRDFAQMWRGADKVVYSTTLAEATTSRTRIERAFDAEAVRRMKAGAERDLVIGGPSLAGQAIAARLVDEYHLFVTPVVVGGGKRWLPEGVRLELELLDERRFAGGMAYLRYGIAR